MEKYKILYKKLLLESLESCKICENLNLTDECTEKCTKNLVNLVFLNKLNTQKTS